MLLMIDDFICVESLGDAAIHSKENYNAFGSSSILHAAGAGESKPYVVHGSADFFGKAEGF